MTNCSNSSTDSVLPHSDDEQIIPRNGTYKRKSRSKTINRGKFAKSAPPCEKRNETDEAFSFNIEEAKKWKIRNNYYNDNEDKVMDDISKYQQLPNMGDFSEGVSS